MFACYPSRATAGVVVSTAPFNLAMRPTLERFRSRIASAICSGDFFHQHKETACAIALGCLRTTPIRPVRLSGTENRHKAAYPSMTR